MTKTKFKCNMQLDRARKTIAATVDELKGWEKKGIYIPGSEAWNQPAGISWAFPLKRR